MDPASDPNSDIGIICVCPEGFDHVWTVRHQVATRLAERHWTIWLEPARGWRDVSLKSSLPRIFVVPGYARLLRFIPGILPVVYKPKWVGRFLDTIRLRLARRALCKRGCRQICLYIWRPAFEHYLQLLNFDSSIYHIDDEYTFSNDETDIPLQERSLIEKADHVIIHSPALLQKKGGINPSTTWIPNGVDYEQFSTPREEPDDLQNIPRPRAALVGVIKNQLDLALLAALAENRPKTSFVLVGPRGMLGADEGLLDKMVAMPNVHELGAKRPDELGAYMQHMDVLLLCYKNDAYTKYIYPLKLHEYLATGRPVIATPIRTVEDFDHVVSLASTRQEWLDALDVGLSEGSMGPERSRERQAVAKEFDWDRLVAKIERIIVSGA